VAPGRNLLAGVRLVASLDEWCVTDGKLVDAVADCRFANFLFWLARRFTGMSDRETAPDWREDTGELRQAVEKYLGDEAMTARDIALVRIFLRRSIEAKHPHASASMMDVLHTQVDDITMRGDIDRWLDRAAAEGIDPL
jgi:hypothetical protein